MPNSRTIYTEEFRVRGNETDRTGKLSLQALTNLLQESAGNHAAQLGFSVQALQAGGNSWLLYRIQLSIMQWPYYGDIIRIETWPSGIRGLYAFREFDIFFKDKKVGSASTAWLVFNLNKRRLIKIPAEFDKKIPSSDKGPLIDLKRNFSKMNGTANELTVKVGYPHLDLNNHTNNVYYYLWMMMATPEKIHKERELTFMDAIFKNETGLDDDILIETVCEENKVSYRLTAAETGKEVMISETHWKDKL